MLFAAKRWSIQFYFLLIWAFSHSVSKISPSFATQGMSFFDFHWFLSVRNTLRYNSNMVKVKSLSHVRLFATPWTIAHQASPSMEFSRHEYWSGLPLPSPEDRPDPGLNPGLPHCRQMLYHLSHQGTLIW